MEEYKAKWKQLLTKKRLEEEKEYRESDSEKFRTEFDKDFDRIIFSTAFRRLGRKTQVHPLATNDHVHTRLTHSLEVASVGRTLGTKLGFFLQERNELPENLVPQDVGTVVQAACLSHDIGNPPFGHAGEYAIRHWFERDGQEVLNKVFPNKETLTDEQKKDFLMFEGNAQGFRIVTRLENYLNEGGLRLTYATLGTLIKYPWDSSFADENKHEKFNVFQSEKEYFVRIFEDMGLKNGEKFSRHPLSYLMEASDDICYKILDLEDAVELGIVDFDTVKQLLEKIISEYETISEGKVSDVNVSDIGENYEYRRRIGKYRAKAINALVNMIFDVFKENYDSIMKGDFEGDLFRTLKEKNKNLSNIMSDIDDLTNSNVFAERKKVEVEIGSYEIIGKILKELAEAVADMKQNGENISFKSERLLKLIGKEQPVEKDSYYECLMKITDFVSGMTDNFALDISKKLDGIF
ncbi:MULTISPECIES: deoxyguanosinetriphosphate triphosphohydrolase [unclassified Nitratiruptor]|uniref:deoxyguanosinetriphosphate triphosphohydrolase n=1 Tax=unclassified Nitratiruptor TaxID=2624044 RepID=UPI0019167B5A|nr:MULTISPECIES: deoxyguanosinetriphosphate triphosphohydrolase [unclassified Nitratiruptor]BCD59436.1 dGTPase [Nitratiruptor sp. YY08-10]BCD63360.1 dGTPase [Nitratiruptor sp. YY08-14]